MASSTSSSSAVAGDAAAAAAAGRTSSCKESASIWEVLESKVFGNNNNDFRKPSRRNFDVLELAAGGKGTHAEYFCRQIELLWMRRQQQQQPAVENGLLLPALRYYPTDASSQAIESLRRRRRRRQRHWQRGMQKEGGAGGDRMTMAPSSCSSCIQEPMQLTLCENEPTGAALVGDAVPVADGDDDENSERRRQKRDAVADFPSCFDLVLNINMVHSAPPSATAGLMKAARHYLEPDQGVLLVYGPLHLLHLSRPFRSQRGGESDEDAVVKNLDDVVALAERLGDLELIEPPIQVPPNNNLCLLFRRRKVR